MNTLKHLHLPLCAGLLAATALCAPASAQGSGTYTPVATYYIPLNDTPIANGIATLNGNVYLGAPQIKVCLGNDPNLPTTCADQSAFALSLEAGFSVEVRSVTGGAVAVDLPLPP
ncbi:MAG TPA: hypothetical protein VMT18_04000, partial [Planctomycetota bacterium]|nr:hypothetical protein [Planctomycetota bacterium]